MKIEERWRDIPEYKGVYRVSDQGKIKRILPHLSKRSNGILQPVKRERGSLFVSLSKSGQKPFRKSVGYFVLLAFIGLESKYYVVGYRDDDMENNKLENLYWTTRASLLRHLAKTQKRPRGSKNGMSKLNETEAVTIKRLMLQGISHRIIAEQFNVSKICITDISRNRTWKHITI